MTRGSEVAPERCDRIREHESLCETFGQYRVIGEDAPASLATGLALLGAMFAIAAASSVPPELLEQNIAQTRATKQTRATQYASDAPPPAIVEQPSESPAPPVSVAAIEEPERRDDTKNSLTDERKASSAERKASNETSCHPVISIAFARGSARPIPAGVETSVNALAQWMTQHKDAVLSVEGHADSTGSERHNVLLSFWRAKAVIAWLASLGVVERQMVARAVGTSEPKGLPKDGTSNRRVLLQIEGVGNCREGGETTEVK